MRKDRRKVKKEKSKIVILIIIIISFILGVLVSNATYKCEERNIEQIQDIIEPKNNSEIEYINLNKAIDDVVYITDFEKIDGDKYRLKGIKYVPYQISEEEFSNIEKTKKYNLYGTEYEYITNDEENILKDSKTGKEFYIEPYKIKSYTLYSKNEYNQVLRKTSKYLYIDVDKNIVIKDSEENNIMSVEKYFSKYKVIEVDDNSNPDSKNTFYFEFDDETKEANCTGIIKAETLLD